MAYEYITAHDSPNYTPAGRVRAVFGHDRKIESITIHHWGVLGQKFEHVIHWFLSPAAGTSAHYIVEDGRVACLVDVKDAAWHAGNARGNATSIGLELRPEATDGDYATAAELIAKLRSVFGDLPLVEHNEWRPTQCPGRWDLDRLDALARGEDTPAAAGPIVRYTVNTNDPRGVNLRSKPSKDSALWSPRPVPVGTTLTGTGRVEGDYVEVSSPWMLEYGHRAWAHIWHLDTVGAPIEGKPYRSGAATHAGRRIEYHVWEPEGTPTGAVVYLHGDNKPGETTTPGGTQVGRMAAAALAAGRVFILAVSPGPSWYLNEEADQSDAYKNQRTPGSQVQALRTFIPAALHEAKVPSGTPVEVVGHSGGGEAITLHLARTDVAWAQPWRVGFTVIGAGTPNGVHPIDVPSEFRKEARLLFVGSSTGDGVGATTANSGAWSAWSSAQRGLNAYRAAGYTAELWDTKAPGHNAYDFGGIVARAVKGA